MNKGRRQELRKLKYKKRLKRVFYSDNRLITVTFEEFLSNPKQGIYNFTCFKDQSTPCSCYFCKGEKYKRFRFKKETQRILKNYKSE